MFNDIITKIRDYLKSESIIGKSSIYYCILFLIIRLLNDSLCQRLNIDTKYTFNNLFNNGNTNKNVLYEKIYNPLSEDCLYTHLIYKLNLRLPKHIEIRSPEKLYNILFILNNLEINKIEENYDIIGTIYELHLKTGTTGGKDLGQYFTNRKVIKYMVEMIKPQIEETICDPAMGTGGFLTIYVKHLNGKLNEKHIYGFDIDEEIANLATLNLFLETGERFTNLYCQNILTTNIENKFDIILANVPMGINIDYNLCSNKIKSLKIKTSKCESLFVQLITQMLNVNGRACIIVPEGFLANKDKTREYLINNFEVQKIVHLNGKFFLNTTIDTYIIYFINSGKKTENVEFYVLDENVVENKILDVKYNEILNKDYKLIYKLYISLEKYNYKYCKIKDICTFLPKSKRKANYGKETGLFPFYCSTEKIKYCDECDYNVESIIIGTGGNANIKYGVKFSCSTDNFILTSKYEDILTKYIYYYLENNIDILKNGFYGTAIKHISKKYIENIEIPIPPVEKQKLIINKMDMLNNKEQQIMDGINKYNDKIKNMFKFN
ncbi:MAG: N-6 DNA methylase [Candidatus Micrarchaeaceae archaeon]